MWILHCLWSLLQKSELPEHYTVSSFWERSVSKHCATHSWGHDCSFVALACIYPSGGSVANMTVIFSLVSLSMAWVELISTSSMTPNYPSWRPTGTMFIKKTTDIQSQYCPTTIATCMMPTLGIVSPHNLQSIIPHLHTTRQHNSCILMGITSPQKWWHQSLEVP